MERRCYLTRKKEVVVSVQHVNLSVSIVCKTIHIYIYLFGSAPKAGSSWNGLKSMGAPLFQRPTIRAPRSSLPSAAVRVTPFPSFAIGFFCRKSLNSGTSWKSQRKATKLPSTFQGALIPMPGSPVCPVTRTPGSTVLGPGLMTVSKPLTTGLEIPSKKPKLGLGLSSYSHRRQMKTYCSCPDSAPGRTSPLMVMTSLIESPKMSWTSAFFLSIVGWLSPEIRMTPCKSWRKCSSQSGVLPSLFLGSPRLSIASCF